MMPEKIDRYEIKSELGRGGMGTVYKAFDPTFKREVAVKVLPAELLVNAELRARFEREAQTIAQLEHPAIVPVYDFGEQDGQPFLVMRFMGGGSLAGRLANGPLPLAETIRIAGALAGGLDKAHSKGIVHRDLKPGNILFDSENNPYIADFGIAKLTQGSVALTQTATVMGTPAYMSPEQVRGDPSIDGRSDIYAFGAIIFEMLTGRVPYQADTPYALMMKHVMDPVPRILDNNPRLPAVTQIVINRAMAKNREERFRTMEEMADMLEAAEKPGAAPVELPGASAVWKQATMAAPPASPAMGMQRPPTYPPGTPPPLAAPQARRRLPTWIWLAGGGALALCLCIGGVALVVPSLLNAAPSAVAMETEPPLEETPTPELLPTQELPPTPDSAATQAAQAAAATATAQVLAVNEAQQRGTQTAIVEATQRAEAVANARATTEARGGTPTADIGFTNTIYDAFDDNTYGWTLGDWDDELSSGLSEITDGKYRWAYSIKEAEVFMTDYPDLLPTANDFTVYVEVQMVEGPTDGEYGIYFRAVDSENFYVFEVSNDSYYIIYSVTDGSWEPIVDWTYSEAIQSYGLNSLLVMGIGSEFYFTINETYLTTISDDRLASGGVGLLVELNNVNDSALYEFDNFAFVSLD